MSEMTVHVWGFVRDGMWSAPNGASATAETPTQVHNRVISNIQHFGGLVEHLVSTWGAAGWLVGTTFETPERDNGRAAHMWHVIQQADAPWAAKPAADLRDALDPQ